MTLYKGDCRHTPVTIPGQCGVTGSWSASCARVWSRGGGMAVKRFLSDGPTPEMPPHRTQPPGPRTMRLAGLMHALVAHRAEIADHVAAAVSTKPGGPPSGLQVEQLREHVLGHV